MLVDYTITLTVSDAAGNNDSCDATVSLTGPDNDCDLVANGCDQCVGADDTIDNDNDGLPDCAFPPASYADVEELWKCGTVNGVEYVWVCHAPFQSICTEYDSVFLHVSFHQNDYLGPCFTIGCVFDAQEPNNKPTEIMGHSHIGTESEIQLSCKTVIDNLICGEDGITEKLQSSLEIEQLPCEQYSLELSHTESEIETALCIQEQLTVEITVTDECGHKESCLTTILMQEHRLDIYPNPATAEINISNLKGEKYSLYTINGELVLKDLDEDKVELGNIKAGIYIIVTDSGRSKRVTIVK